MNDTMEICSSCGHKFGEDEEFMEMSESMLGIFEPEHFGNMCMPCYRDLDEDDEDEDYE